jgi:tetratricopeptide (TPR) repeat protein
VAQSLLEEALAICRELGDRQGIASALHNLGNVARPLGDLAAAQAYYQECLAIYRELGNEALAAYPWLGLGTVAARQGEWAVARGHLARSLAAWHQAGEDREILLALEGMASVEAAEGRPERGARLLGAADALRETNVMPPRSPSEQDEYERALASARVGLDEAEFAVAWGAGRALDLGQAVAEALEGSSP